MATNPAVRRLLRPPRRPAGRKLAMRRAWPLRESVLHAFAGTLRYARAAARRAAVAPEESVHEFRKSIRRARAVVGLLRPALGARSAFGLARELKRAFAETGAFRDADVLLATLRLVAVDDPALPAIEEALGRERARDGSAAEALESGSRILRPLPDALRVTLPESFSMDDLARGLSRSVRRVQEALARAAESGHDTDFHEWRKRVKELRYQLEMLASSGSAALKHREKTLSALAEELGEATDLILLGAAVAQRSERGEIPRAPALGGAIRAAISARSQALVARGQAMFAPPPGEFARLVLAERG
ncbi:MAG TPA: CHAD domain-containing protein [Thermoanaerobaculia bacterium]|jgi:CHAD domain-containing protein|nr:CHAD domain-containing protein [Thermoanaerobaculia bacterium]